VERWPVTEIKELSSAWRWRPGPAAQAGPPALGWTVRRAPQLWAGLSGGAPQLWAGLSGGAPQLWAGLSGGPPSSGLDCQAGPPALGWTVRRVPLTGMVPLLLFTEAPLDQLSHEKKT
jgi:hypothetical protein